MAYKQFLTKAKEAGLLNEFSPQDLQIAYEKPEFGMAILGLKQDYKNATTDEGRALAHATAEQLRSEYKHTIVPKTASPSAATAGAYGNTTGFKDTLAKIEQMNYPTWKQGDSYKELEGSFVDAGQRAMQDTLAQVSARTGGMASSYAGGAAQGAYNEYMKQLDEAAYNRYLAERGEMVDLMQMQMNADNIEYGKTLDRIAAERDAEATAYERSMAEDSISYERQMLEREQAMETVNNMIAMGATLADIPADLLAKSGYGESYVNVGNADYQRRNAPKPVGGGGGVVAAEPIEEEPEYGEELTQGQISELLSKYGKNKTLTADEWDALGRMGYTLNYEDGKIKYTAPVEEPIEEGDEKLFNMLMTNLKNVQGYESKERLRELLTSFVDRLSDEQVGKIMEAYGL